MDASLETLVIAGYVFACSLSTPRPGPAGKVTDQELIALAVAQAVTGLVSDRQFSGTIGRLLPGFFPDLPEQSQYNRRLRRLPPWNPRGLLAVAELIADGHVRLVDGPLLGRDQLRRVRFQERVRRTRQLWLLRLKEPVVLDRKSAV